MTIIDHREGMMTFAKGTKYFGEPLPWLEKNQKPPVVIEGTWWTQERVTALAVWQETCLRALPKILASEASVRRSAEHRAQAKLDAQTNKGQPFELQHINIRRPKTDEWIDEVENAVADALATRNHMRSRLGCDETTSVDTAVEKAMRRPDILLELADLGYVPKPVGIVPASVVAEA